MGYTRFPYLAQAMRIERTVTKLDGTPMRHDVSYAITSLAPEQASAQRLLELNRGHWTIENKVHYVRDRIFDEDRSQVRKGAAPRAMASLRNTAISAVRIASGATANISAALQHLSRKVRTVLRLIGL